MKLKLKTNLTKNSAIFNENNCKLSINVELELDSKQTAIKKETLGI